MHKCILSHSSCVWFFATLWTVAWQAALSMGFSRQEYWRGLPFQSPGNLPYPGVDSRSHALADLFFTTAAAAAKSLQSCPTLCDPIDGSPPGSPIPGIPQARTLEWVAISFHEREKWKWSRSVVSNFSRPHGLQPTRLLHPWDSPGKYWSRVPLPSLTSTMLLNI